MVLSAILEQFKHLIRIDIFSYDSQTFLTSSYDVQYMKRVLCFNLRTMLALIIMCIRQADLALHCLLTESADTVVYVYD